jgi:hypothetical protein
LNSIEYQTINWFFNNHLLYTVVLA